MAHPLSFLYIYLTDVCNLQCAHCWQSAPISSNHRETFLSFRSCERFLNDAIGLGLQRVTLSGGEPLLSPYFSDFVDYFHRNGIECWVETNGMLISGPRLEAIQTYNVHCAISLDGVRPETHNRQRRRADAFDKTVCGMQRLEAASIPYQIIMSISKANYGELVPLLDWVRSSWVHCDTFKINIIMPEGRAELMARDGLLFAPLELITIADEVGRVAKQYPFNVVLHLDPAFFSVRNFSKHFCCGGNCGYEHGLSVLASGEVSICSLGKIVDSCIFGHVANIDTADVWENHPLLQVIHEGGYKHLQGVCAECIFRRRCGGGCRALALRVYGNIFAPAPICQAYFDSGNFPPSRLIRPERATTGTSIGASVNGPGCSTAGEQISSIKP